MKLTVEINFGNEAMSNLNDASRSLDWLAKNLANLHNRGYQIDDPLGGHLLDDNGNTIGSWDVEDPAT